MGRLSSLLRSLSELFASGDGATNRGRDVVVKGRCPCCAEVPLTPEHGALHEAVCPRCQGRFLPREAMERLVVEELGIEREILLELADTLAVPTMTCPGCTSALSALVLRGVPLSLCKSCGGMWCDAGELSMLSSGRYAEVTADAAAAVDADGRTRCVLQLEPPFAGEAALTAAFTRAPRLSRADATRAARMACGVLAEAVTDEEARVLVDALRAGGVGCESASMEELRLPRAREIIVVEPEAAALVLRDQYGKRREIPWRDIRVAAVARMTRPDEERRRSTPLTPPRRGPGRSAFGALSLPDAWPEREGSQIVEDIVLELLLEGDRERFRVRARTVGLKQEARTGTRNDSFLELAKKILARVEEAALPWGTRAFLDDGEVSAYDNPWQLERELAWTRWRRRRAVTSSAVEDDATTAFTE